MKNFYLIGLTGNLGSGKSTVRRQLEQLGAFGIDADLLAHNVMRRGSSAWVAIFLGFGLGVLKWNGKINRKKLGARVFANPQALARLEQILHPAVEERIKAILQKTSSSVVVIEAIKLIEAGLHDWCDAVWVVTCKPEVQIERVARDRYMRVKDAQARLDSQGSLDEKLKFATAIIDNSGDLNATQTQVQRAWDAIQPETARAKTPWLYGSTPPFAVQPAVISPPAVKTAPPVAQHAVQPATLEIRRAHKSDLDALAFAFARREHLRAPLSHAETLQRFGAHGYRIAVSSGRAAAFIAWDAENLVAVASQVWAESAQAAGAIAQLFATVESEAKQLQCEVLLVLIDSMTPAFVIEQVHKRNYHSRELRELHPVWRQVAVDRVEPEGEIWVKLLRGELITQPF